MLLKPSAKICKNYRNLKCLECVKKQRAGILRGICLPLTNFFFNKFIKKIDRFIVLSKSSKNILINYGVAPSNINIVYLPFKSQKIKKEKIKKNSLLYVGWLEPHKGLHILINAMNLVIQTIPDAKLYAIGSHEFNFSYFKKIKSLINKLNLKNNIFLLGRKGTSEFKKIFSESELILIPEQWENMSPLFLIESMSYGKPIIASNIGGLPEFINNGTSGFLVEPKNYDAFARRIIELLNDKEKANKFGIMAKKIFLDNFNKRKILANLINSYSLTLKNGK